MLIACTVLVNNDEDDDAVAVGEWEKVKLRTMAEVCLLVGSHRLRINFVNTEQ